VETQAGQWFGTYIAAFLLGAATGGLLFGWLGDHIGRAKTMGLSILCYSLFIGLSYFAQSLEQLLVLRFVACLGVGGMWPTGVALASEAWPEKHRPILAGLIGTSANVGLALMGAIAYFKVIDADHWRWVMLVGASPTLLGLFVLVFVPESPRWLATRREHPQEESKTPVAVVFRPPYLKYTLIGICLGTIPLLGGWGALNWLIKWADQVGKEIGNPQLKATTQFIGSSGAAIGSLLGGWIASKFGRRTTYFAISLGTLLVSGYIFWRLSPTDGAEFLVWVFVLRLVMTTYFGWLPYYLPELFPTRIRSTGSGITFNFGRILSAAGVMGTAALVGVFDGDYARIGRVTHLIFALGMIVICFAPDTSKKRMED
jgi:MFS family permease